MNNLYDKRDYLARRGKSLITKTVKKSRQ